MSTSFREDMNAAAAGVVKKHWEIKQDLLNLISKITSEQSPFKGSECSNIDPVAYGVSISYASDYLDLTFTDEGKYKFLSPLKDETYSETAKNEIEAINKLHEWIAKMGLAHNRNFFKDIYGTTSSKPEAAPAP